MGKNKCLNKVEEHHLTEVFRTKKKMKKLENEMAKVMAEEQGPDFSKWYREYQRLEGRETKGIFARNLNVFFELTLNPFVYGNLEKADGTLWESRDEAWSCFVERIGSEKEANRYFDAVDHITTYT